MRSAASTVFRLFIACLLAGVRQNGVGDDWRLEGASQGGASLRLNHRQWECSFAQEIDKTYAVYVGKAGVCFCQESGALNT